MNSKDYWEKRAIERLTRAEVRSEPYLKQIYGIYTSAQKQTVQDIQHLYRIYYAENKWDTAALNAIAPSGDLVKFYNQLRAAGLEKRLPERFNGRLSRLELLNANYGWRAKKSLRSRMKWKHRHILPPSRTHTIAPSTTRLRS